MEEASLVLVAVAAQALGDVGRHGVGRSNRLVSGGAAVKDGPEVDADSNFISEGNGPLKHNEITMVHAGRSHERENLAPYDLRPMTFSQ